VALREIAVPEATLLALKSDVARYEIVVAENRQ
jgi:hypothetical protein